MESESELEAVRRALAHFVRAPVEELAAYGGGHIHDTFLARAGQERLIVQRFNERVFGDIAAVMSNVVRVTDHARRRFSGAEAARRVLRVRRTDRGEAYLRDHDGVAYRVLDYVANSYSVASASDPRVAFEAGRAFGGFVASLRDLPPPPLAVTIPGFHDTAQRLDAFRNAFVSDPLGRASALTAEVALIERHAELAGRAARLAASGALPLRVTHNDAKLDNVLFDRTSGEALCVVDLDTVMPGFVAYDFGDLVRTTACVGDEDGRDLSTHQLRLDLFEALARGYLGETSDFIEPRERESLGEGVLFILLELGLRFLTDHLLGDRYFKIARPDHNLDRARVQLHLLEALTAQRDALRRAFDRIS